MCSTFIQLVIVNCQNHECKSINSLIQRSNRLATRVEKFVRSSDTCARSITGYESHVTCGPIRSSHCFGAENEHLTVEHGGRKWRTLLWEISFLFCVEWPLIWGLAVIRNFHVQLWTEWLILTMDNEGMNFMIAWTWNNYLESDKSIDFIEKCLQHMQ